MPHKHKRRPAPAPLTLLDLFQAGEESVLSRRVSTTTNEDEDGSSSSSSSAGETGTVAVTANFNPVYWSSQGGAEKWGVNMVSPHGYKARWGYAWNNEGDFRSNDAGGGLGTEVFSAGDRT